MPTSRTKVAHTNKQKTTKYSLQPLHCIAEEVSFFRKQLSVVISKSLRHNTHKHTQTHTNRRTHTCLSFILKSSKLLPLCCNFEAQCSDIHTYTFIWHNFGYWQWRQNANDSGRPERLLSLWQNRTLPRLARTQSSNT